MKTMDKKHLLWITPLTAITFIIIGVTVGITLGYNNAIIECQQTIDFNNALCELENSILDQCLDMWTTYEYNCPEVYNGLLNNSIPIIRD